MWGMIISIISGILMSVQGVFNTEVTEATNIWITAAFVQLTAFIVCIGAWFGICTNREYIRPLCCIAAVRFRNSG